MIDLVNGLCQEQCKECATFKDGCYDERGIATATYRQAGKFCLSAKRDLDVVREWLSSFDTESATKCFEAVNLLKERLKNET